MLRLVACHEHEARRRGQGPLNLAKSSYLQDKQKPTNMSACNLTQHEIPVEEVHRNLPPSALYEHAILYEKDAHIAENGALVAYSGSKTGRSPKDKRVVKQSPSENEGLVGDGQHPARSAHICDNPRARSRLP